MWTKGPIYDVGPVAHRKTKKKKRFNFKTLIISPIKIFTVSREIDGYVRYCLNEGLYKGSYCILKIRF